MKITCQTEPPAFTPVDVTFHCETQEELDVLGTLFNYTPIAKVVCAMSSCNLWKAKWATHLIDAGADIHSLIDPMDDKFKELFASR